MTHWKREIFDKQMKRLSAQLIFMSFRFSLYENFVIMAVNLTSILEADTELMQQSRNIV